MVNREVVKKKKKGKLRKNISEKKLVGNTKDSCDKSINNVATTVEIAWLHVVPPGNELEPLFQDARTFPCWEVRFTIYKRG